MTIEKAQDSAAPTGAASALSAGLERPVLCVRPHRHRELLKLPEELEVGWLRGGHFWGFAACKNAAAFDALCEDLRKHHGEIDIRDMRSNVELTGAAAGLSPQRPATEGSEVERRVGPLDGKCGFCGAVAHAGEEWGYTKDLAQQWVLSCPRCCSEAGGAVREIAANGLPGASKW